MTYEEFVERYKPMENPLEDAAYNGYLFETYGEEFDMVRQYAPESRVWTLVEGDDDREYLISGLRFVNRIGYFITEVPHDGQDIEIALESVEDDAREDRIDNVTTELQRLGFQQPEDVQHRDDEQKRIALLYPWARIELHHGRTIVCGGTLPSTEIKAGQLWQGSGGHTVVVDRVDGNSVYYSWEEDGQRRTHDKALFAFQCRYCLVLPSPDVTATPSPDVADLSNRAYVEDNTHGATMTTGRALEIVHQIAQHALQRARGRHKHIAGHACGTVQEALDVVHDFVVNNFAEEDEAAAPIGTQGTCVHCGCPIRVGNDGCWVHDDDDEDPESFDYGWTFCSGDLNTCAEPEDSPEESTDG